jgi:hypothetical protein
MANHDMTLALIAAGAAIAGGLITGAYQHARDWFNRPKLRIDSKESAANKVDSEYKKPDGTTVSEIYIRARVQNTGRQIAKGCVVSLAKLEKVHPSGRTTSTVFFDSRPLAWAGWKFLPRDVPSGVDFYVDLMRVSKSVPGWKFSVEKLFGNEAALQSYWGTYRFSLVVTADNAKPASCRIDITYNGDWHNLNAVQVPSA